MQKRYWLLPLVALIVGSFAAPAQAQEIWAGYDYFFEKENYADWTLEENQDRITDIVWITRADQMGIFNIHNEDSYIDFESPSDTEWAMGTTDDYDTLDYVTWVEWTGFNPPGTVGQNAVVHLITDDIYIDIRFESWQSGGQGGGFSYYRGTPDAVATDETSWGKVKALFR
ncbi:MAG: hypothetical protein GF328_02925 [Candidatus Latescibacteria bacterium]|nr:hypothetical protein [Candidatus Latescibacterota bacterium]